MAESDATEGATAKKRGILSHEALNTLIAATALIVSAVTAWVQFAPESDRVEIISQERVRSHTPVKLDNTPIPLPNQTQGTVVVGPIFWRVVLFNPTGHPVPVTGIGLSYGHPQGEIRFSKMLAGISTESDGRPAIFPVMLAPHEGKSLLIAAHVPVQGLVKGEELCARRLQTLQDFENCLFDRGRDLFGNKGTRLTRGTGFSWQTAPSSPEYVALITTAGGFEARKTLTYYPDSFTHSR